VTVRVFDRRLQGDEFEVEDVADGVADRHRFGLIARELPAESVGSTAAARVDPGSAIKSRSWTSASWRVNISFAILWPPDREKILTCVGAAGEGPAGQALRAT
jgi:hypothetical protein